MKLGSAKKSKPENATKTANKKKRVKESDDDYLHSCFTKRQKTVLMTRSNVQKRAWEANDEDEVCTSLAKNQKGM